jgi:hypothetical protein
METGRGVYFPEKKIHAALPSHFGDNGQVADASRVIINSNDPRPAAPGRALR